MAAFDAKRISLEEDELREVCLTNNHFILINLHLI
jgi:hypothetical protein